METKSFIDAIETLCAEMETAPPIERIKLYATIKLLSNEVLQHVQECKDDGLDDPGLGNSGRYFSSLLSHVRAAAGLGGTGHLDDQEFAWVRQDIGRLKSNLCFDLEP